MAGYDNSWIINALQAGGLTKAQRLQRQHQAEQDEFERGRLEAEQARLAQADTAKQHADAAKTLANKQRFFSDMLKAQPGQAPQIRALAQRHGVEIAPEQTRVSLGAGPAAQSNYDPGSEAEQIQANPIGEQYQRQAIEAAPETAAELEASASGVLGVRKPEEQDKAPTTPGYTDFKLAQQDPGYAAHIATERAAKAKGGNTPTERDLRKDFDALPAVKNMGTIAEAYERIKGAPNDSVGHQTLIFSIMKMQDPNSSVREGEYATAENAGGVLAKVRNTWNRLVAGEKLDDALYARYKQEAARIHGAQISRYEDEAEEYRTIAREAGFNPDRVVLPRSWDRKPEQTEAPAAPEARRQILSQMNAMVDQLKATGIPEEQAKQMALSKYRPGGQ